MLFECDHIGVMEQFQNFYLFGQILFPLRTIDLLFLIDLRCKLLPLARLTQLNNRIVAPAQDRPHLVRAQVRHATINLLLRLHTIQSLMKFLIRRSIGVLPRRRADDNLRQYFFTLIAAQLQFFECQQLELGVVRVFS